MTEKPETINFTQQEIARLNRMIGITLKNGEVEIDEISDSGHQKIADAIAGASTDKAQRARWGEMWDKKKVSDIIDLILTIFFAIIGWEIGKWLIF